ncbi:hypothetical protein [Neisseria sicca]
MFNSRKARILALAEQQKQQIARENQEQKIVNGSSNSETALYEEAYQNAQEDLNMFVKCWSQESNLHIL